MITIEIKDAAVKQLLKALPKQAGRAAEQALDFTAVRIGDAVRTQMLRSFDKPTQFTLNSLKVTKTRNHNMLASVWFKDPDRMGQHYLVPQVEGGKRKLKGFERGLGGEEYVPGRGAKIDSYGNISAGQIKQIMSVLGKAETSAGYSANLTARSAKTNTKARDYVYLPKGSGRLPPGVYKRVQTARGFGAKTSRALGFGAWQRGTRKTAIKARGLSPILIKGRTGHNVRPLLPFYAIALSEYERRFLPHFAARFNALMR